MSTTPNIPITVTVSESVCRVMVYVIQTACIECEERAAWWNGILNAIEHAADSAFRARHPQCQITLLETDWLAMLDMLDDACASQDPQWIEWQQNVYDIVSAALDDAAVTLRRVNQPALTLDDDVAHIMGSTPYMDPHLPCIYN